MDTTSDSPVQPAADPLLQALSWLTRHHGHERSPESLAAGRAIKGRLSAEGAAQLLQDAGFQAGVLHRRLPDLSTLLMPAVLLLDDGDACIVTARHVGAEGAEPRYEVVVPQGDGHAVTLGEQELCARHAGLVIVGTPAPAPARDPSLHAVHRHWLWGTLRRFLPYYRSAMLAALLSNVLMLAISLITSVVFDKVIPRQAFVTLWTLAAGGAIALVFDLLSRQLRSHLIDLAGKKADLLVGSRLFRQTLGVRMEHRPASAGGHAHHLAQIEIVREFFASASLSAISDLPFIVLFVAMVFVVGGPLGWVLVVAVPLLLGLTLAIQGSLRRAMRANLEHHADLQGVLVEALEGLEDVKTSGAQGRFVARYEHATAAATQTALRARSLSAFTNNLTMTAQQVVTLVMLTWGVYLIHEGAITPGALVGAVMIAGRAIAPLGSVVALATRFQGARGAMQALDRLMSLPPEREPDRDYVPLRAFDGAVALHQVSFAYPPQGPSDTAPPKVLQAVNLAFRPGERVAILGRIGSGKSTILRLLAGLYQPTEGHVEAGGMDLRQVDPADFRSHVGFVSQEPRLFNGTLRENVLMGRPSADAARLAEVARLTGLDRLVAAHPLGWERPVGEMGGLLSGGQRQLVALARSLAARPKLLLMDEPTSSMDAQSEILFLRQLKEAVEGCTLVMVTHRPAVLELVDRIIVVDGGRPVMDGPKPQVLAALAGGQGARAADVTPLERRAA